MSLKYDRDWLNIHAHKLSIGFTVVEGIEVVVVVLVVVVVEVVEVVDVVVV